MSKQESGFTLIELVMVIVILGILAAVAIPKFVDLSTQANQAAAKGTAGAVSSGFANNYAAALASAANSVAVTGTAIGIPAVAGSILGGAGLPTGYSVYPTGSISCTNGASAGSTNAISVWTGNSTASGAQSAAATLICTG